MFIIILIVTVLIINNMWSKDEKKNTNTTGKVLAGNVESQVSTSENTDDLETRLKNILETINGVGKVKVLLKELNIENTNDKIRSYNYSTRSFKCKYKVINS